MTDLFGSITPPTPAATATDSGVLGASTNQAREKLAVQFRATVSQITNIARDSAFNGVNLLMGQSVDLIFTEDEASRIEVNGVKADADSLGIFETSAVFNFQSNSEVDAAIDSLRTAYESLKSHGALFAVSLAWQRPDRNSRRLRSRR